MLDILDYPSMEYRGYRELEWTLNQILSEMGKEWHSNILFTAVYGAYLCQKYKVNTPEALENFIKEQYPERRYYYVNASLKGDYAIPFDLNNTGKFTEETYINYFKYCSVLDVLYRDDGAYGTPYSVSELTSKVLDIKKTDYVADLCCGIGDYLCQLIMSGSKVGSYGIDINTEAVEVASIRTEVLGGKSEIEQGDLFDLSSERVFDKIFSNYPIGIPMKEIVGRNTEIDELFKKLPDLRRATSSEWLFNAQIIKHLKKNGKAVVIMNNGSTWNSLNKKIREHFVREGFIEAVIALPPRMFSHIQAATDMVVLSYDNKSVRMIDASEICVKGRRQTELSDENIAEIVSLLKKDSERAVTVDINTLKENEYVLNPARYLDTPLEIEDGVTFGSIIKHITRGAQLSARELDQLVTDENTGIKYLMLSDIQNGIISDDLKNLTGLDAKYDRYFIHDKSLLLSKNGAPFKVAIAEINDGERILGNGNLFIIELDEKKANPYYIKAFFNSEIGITSLKKIAVGATIPNIAAESLKKMIVPLPSLEKQNKVAEMYQSKVDEIKVLQLRLKKAQEDLKGIFGEVD